MTQAEYARHRGVSREAVRKAVRDRRILLVKGKIDPAAADRAWRANTDTSKASNSVTGEPKGAGKGPRRGRRARTAAPAGAGDTAAAATETLIDTTHQEYNVAKRDEKHWAGRLKELEFKRRSGELIERAFAERVFQEAHDRAKSRLAKIADHLAPIVARLKEESDCHQAIREEVQLACNELVADFSG